MTTSTTVGSLPTRKGPPPEVRRPSLERPGPHQQLSQIAPRELQEALLALGRSLPGVTVGRSLVSLPGARAFFLDPALARGPADAFQAATEFAHIHAPFDGSLHVTLPAAFARHVVAQGWGEPHPVQKGLLIYGPRDEGELVIAWRLLQTSLAFARGGWTPNAELMEGASPQDTSNGIGGAPG